MVFKSWLFYHNVSRPGTMSQSAIAAKNVTIRAMTSEGSKLPQKARRLTKEASLCLVVFLVAIVRPVCGESVFVLLLTAMSAFAQPGSSRMNANCSRR